MQALDLKDLKYTETGVGSTIRSSKMRYMWEFRLNSVYHKLELFDSVLSARRKLLLNDTLVYDIMLEEAFSYQFDILKCHCQLIQMGSQYELRIENQVFAHLLEIQKNKSRFQKSDRPTSTTHTLPSSVKRSDSGSFFNNAEVIHTPKETSSPLFCFSIKSSSTSNSQVNSVVNSVSNSAANSPLVPRKFDFNDIKVSHSPRTPTLDNRKSKKGNDLTFVSQDDGFSLDSSPTTAKTSNTDLIDFKKTETVLSKFASMQITNSNLFSEKRDCSIVTDENFNNGNIVYPNFENETKYPSFEEVVNNSNNNINNINNVNVKGDPFAQFF